MVTPLRDTPEAARILGVKEPTLKSWRRKGIGPAWHKIGRVVRYDDRDLDAYKAARRRGGDDEEAGRLLAGPKAKNRETAAAATPGEDGNDGKGVA